MSDDRDDMAPGDDAPADDDWVGVNVCERCGGSGVVDGEDCPACGGTGQINEAVGGG